MGEAQKELKFSGMLKTFAAYCFFTLSGLVDAKG